MKNIIYYLIFGTRGGESRAKIINLIKKTPMNSHKISKELKFDYKTVQHHIRILEKNKIIVKEGSYGGVYFISKIMETHMDIFNEIWDKSGINSGKSL